MRFRLFRSVLILCTTVALATLAASMPAFAKDVTVTISNFAFAPAAISVAVGD